MPTDETILTELAEFEPDRIDGVRSPATGFPILMLKSLEGEVTETEIDASDIVSEIEKADDGGDKPKPCSLCDGTKAIKNGKVKCPQCKGTGIQPKVGQTEKELAAAAKEAGVAASGAPVPVPDDCPACNGTGQCETGECTACAGTGDCADMPAGSELNAVDGDPGKITVGAGGRETVDKSEGDDLEKKNVDPGTGGGVDRDKIPPADFAGPKNAEGDLTYPIVTPGDVSDAAKLIGKADNPDAIKAKIIAIAKRKGASFVAELPKAWTGGDAEKASGDIFSAPNPALTAAASQVTDDSTGDTGDDMDTMAPGAPGSPEWEAVDAQTATDAALALMTAVELMRTFASREQTEVAMGEGNDVFDAYAASDAMCAAQAALGVMAQLAFHEGLEAAKSLPDDESVEKAGRRLAGKTVAALAAARDKAKDLANHIGGVLGDDDPAKKTDGAANKSSDIDMAALAEELKDMTTDELTKVLDARDEKLVGIVADAFKAAIPAAPEAPAKKTKKAAKAEAEAATETETDDTETAKAEGDEEETETETETEDTAAEKAELTEEEIEARDKVKAAKKALKAEKRAEKEAAENAKIAKAIEEGTAKAEAAVASLQEQLEAVKKMAAPSTIVRTAPVEAQNVAKARDELEIRIAELNNIARTTPDQDIRKAKREEAKELSEQLASL